jgi:ribosomal protein L11 methyltransferase
VEYLEMNVENIPDVLKDELIYRLSGEGFESFLDTDNGFRAYIPSDLFLINKIEPFLNELKVAFTWKIIPERNWNEEWEKNYDPVIISNKYHVRAPFHDPLPGIQHEIIIEPKMSFGTAHHETTALMIELILETDCSGKIVLDMGCGTGILAILACKTGAASVVAVDNDEWSFNNAQENIVKNDTDGIDVVLGDIDNLKDHRFDIVFANINRNVLLEQIPRYSVILPRGDLLLSGFYETDLEMITGKAEENDFHLIKYLAKNNWVAAKFRK